MLTLTRFTKALRRQLKGLRDERGASALIIAGSMILIMGIAAIVIDGGLGFSERRQAQSGVDFGALAALREAVSCPSPCTPAQAANNGANEAIAVVAANLPGRTLDWSISNCDPARDNVKFSIVSGVTDCISYTENLDEVRVRLPLDDVETTFGAVVGVDSITVRAEAQAGSRIDAISRVIPNTPLGAAGAEACLFANQAPQAEPPCPGASGFYGYIDLPLYGDDDLGTPSTCLGGTTNGRIAINLAKGGDHSLVTYDPGPPDPIVNDHDACPNSNEDINELRVETGSTTVGITAGLFDGVSGSIGGQPFTASPARLACDLSDYSTMCVSVRGKTIDHTGLWSFLVGGSCPGGTDTHAEMLACLNSGTARFTSALADHPRFAAIPELWTTPTGPGDYTIKDFVPVWIQTIYMDCNANKCDTIHSPGDVFPTGLPPGDPGACPNPLAGTGARNCGWTDTAGPDSVEGMLAFTLDLSMLPTSITDTFPAETTDRSYALTE